MKKEIKYIERPKDGKFLYELVVGKSGRGWIYPKNSTHPASEIHCTNSAEWTKPGEGYGGSTLKFPLYPDGDIFLLMGGWHSNADSLFKDTGVDLRNMYLTRCVISKQIIQSNPYILDDILHEENEWILGNFERPEEIAKALANELGIKVFCYTQSLGGGSMGWVNPDTVSKSLT